MRSRMSISRRSTGTAPRVRRVLAISLLCIALVPGGSGCVTAEMRKEGIPLRKSVVLGEMLAIFPGVIVHGIGHRYAGDAETGASLGEKEWKSLVYPVAWPFLGAATLANPDDPGLAETFDEATGISLVAPFLFLGTWFYDLARTPGRVRAHNRMVDRMWEVKEALDEAGFPEEIDLGSVNPGEVYEFPLDLVRNPRPGIEIQFRLDPLEAPGELAPDLRPIPGGGIVLDLDVPPETPPGSYVYFLWYGPPDVPLRERRAALEVRVLEPDVRLRLIGDSIAMRSGGRGWVRSLAELVYETALEGSCSLEILPLRRDEPVAGRPVVIDPTYDIRIEPRGDWDGETLVPGETYRLEVAVYVSPDLPDGTYRGSLQVRAAPRGHPRETILYPIEIVVDR